MQESSHSSAAWRSVHVCAVVLGFFAVWQLGVVVLRPPDYILPAPSAILLELATAPLWYVTNALDTIGATLLGFAVALLVGCLSAIAIVYSRVLENTLYTLLVATNSVPKIALAPLFIIWLGTGLEVEGRDFVPHRAVRHRRRHGFGLALGGSGCGRSVSVAEMQPLEGIDPAAPAERAAILVRRNESGNLAGSGGRDRGRVRRLASRPRLYHPLRPRRVPDHAGIRRHRPARRVGNNFVLHRGHRRALRLSVARIAPVPPPGSRRQSMTGRFAPNSRAAIRAVRSMSWMPWFMPLPHHRANVE